MGLASELLRHLRPTRLLALIEENLSRATGADEILADFIHYLHQLNPPSILEARPPITKEVTDLLEEILKKARGLPIEAGAALDELARWTESFDAHLRVILLASVQAANPAAFGQLLKRQWMSAKAEAHARLVNFARAQPDVWARLLRREEQLCVPTECGIRPAGNAVDAESRKRLGYVFAVKRDDNDDTVPTILAAEISQFGLSVFEWPQIMQVVGAMRTEAAQRGDRSEYEFYI